MKIRNAPRPTLSPHEERIEVRGRSSILDPQSETELLQKVINLYKGHFLPADAKQPWSTVMRETAAEQLPALVTRTGELHEQAGDWKKAAVCFEQGLERDAVCEEFYQHLMLCRQRLGHRAEAVKTYRRCRTALQNGLGLEPSPRTQEIFSSLLNK